MRTKLSYSHDCKHVTRKAPAPVDAADINSSTDAYTNDAERAHSLHLQAIALQRRDPAAFARSTLLETFALARVGQPPSIHLVARVGVLVTSNANARVALTALADYPSAEHYVNVLADRCYGAARVHLLTLAMFIAYSRGDADTACALALACVENQDRTQSPLLRLLTAALAANVPSSQVQLLTEFGVTLLRTRFGITPFFPSAAAG